MASIPNLNSLRTGRGRARLQRGARSAFGGNVNDLAASDDDVNAVRDHVVQRTDHDASSSRMSAIALGYLDDPFAKAVFPPGIEPPKRYPIINRGTYVRTSSIDALVTRFLRVKRHAKRQIVSLGAGSDTRFFRFCSNGQFADSQVEYHEIDFESNVNQKRHAIRNSPLLSTCIDRAEKSGSLFRLHALNLSDLTAKSPPTIPNLDPDLPTLLLSECCLCYMAPDAATSVLQYFTMHIASSLALVIYEPIRPFDPFGKTMVSNLASRGIHLQTLKRYSTLEAQRRRLRVAGLTGGQCARDVHQLWESEAWTSQAERERLERLEWLDELEEWKLLASHYCVAWGWRGQEFGEAWADLDGARTGAEANDDERG